MSKLNVLICLWGWQNADTSQNYVCIHACVCVCIPPCVSGFIGLYVCLYAVWGTVV